MRSSHREDKPVHRCPSINRVTRSQTHSQPLPVTLRSECHRHSLGPVGSTAPTTTHAPHGVTHCPVRAPPCDSHTHGYTCPQPPVPAATRRNSPPHGPRATAVVGPSSTGSHGGRVIQTLAKYSGSRGDSTTRLPGGVPFRGAGGGRRRPGQSSALSPSSSADGESHHPPLTEPRTLPCTPDPRPGLADEAAGRLPRSRRAVPRVVLWPSTGPSPCTPGLGGGEEWGAGPAGRCCGPCGYCLAA